MAFRFDKLTVKGQEAVQRAQQLAEDKGNSQLSAMHLLAALLDELEDSRSSVGVALLLRFFLLLFSR